MKPSVIAGIVLIILGIAALAYQGFSYTSKEKVLDLGPVEATAETRKTVPIPPIAGILALAGGIALVALGSRKRA